MKQLTCLNEPYFFHFHTDYTDGQLTIEDYFNFCKNHNIKTLIFSEHVRQTLNYNFQDFVDEIYDVQRYFSEINPIVGVEAKVLPGGGCDISEDILDKIQLIAFACHGFPDDPDLFFQSLKTLFDDEQYRSFYRVWAHPGRFYKKRNLLDDYQSSYVSLLEYAVQNNIYIERNLKDQLLPYDYINTSLLDWVIWGLDVHRKADFKLWDSFINECSGGI
jgi:histidinol phosphatase-like PHP family hydrolase